MRKTTRLGIKGILVFLVLISVSLACSIPDVKDLVEEEVFGKCYRVDQATYEDAARELGQTPKTPKYPEYAVFEACYAGEDRQDELVSVRMSEGYRPTEAEGANSLIAGSYIGENLEVPPSWQLVKAEFIIDVGENGAVSGSRTFIVRDETVGPTCTWRWENGHNTIISGQISGAAGFVTVKNDSYTISDGSNCGATNNHQTFESVCEKAQITITGDRLEITGDGSSDCGFVYKATKQ